ncbi:hypothetical protein G7066_00830 [Leucobacter coleopterorum]|uniref:Uncharacterized protein n=1 Tax=Leucobacter coleopterorum TaxID=2714933 RepID=A0ABX6JXH2_9MICO|nr:hypothetical protein [Leucobacter coleopterorum]QIM17617.1 hypothetical protein G7066_00830 [Leucobacter coleopterorum]
MLGTVREGADGVREHLDATLGAFDPARATAESLSDVQESADRQTRIILLRSVMSKYWTRLTAKVTVL